MIHVNCDIGEQPAERERDLTLLALVDAVSIACGGHAGDERSAVFWRDAATAQGKAYHLHLSYPDREHFGRRALNMPWPALADALQQQRHVLPECTAVKFHGALYNQAAADDDLATQLIDWCVHAGITELLAPPDSALALAGRQANLRIHKEGFADRAYQWHDNRLRLMPRDQAGAVHHEPAQVIAQLQAVLETQQLPVGDTHYPFACDTWCVHSDSPSAVTIVQAIRAQWP